MAEKGIYRFRYKPGSFVFPHPSQICRSLKSLNKFPNFAYDSERGEPDHAAELDSADLKEIAESEVKYSVWNARRIFFIHIFDLPILRK